MNFLPGIERAGLVALLAVLTARQLAGLRQARLFWPLLLANYLTPALLTGYAYGNFALSLIHHPFANTALYALLLWFHFTPLAVVILIFAPNPVSPSARHCHRLLGRREFPFWLRSGAARPVIVAFTIITLLTFQEFEFASLLGIKTWTVWLFDAHAGGLPIQQSVRLALGPLAFEVGLLALAFWLLPRQEVRPAAQSSRPTPFAWVYLILAGVVMLILPAFIVLRGTVTGARVLLDNFALGREVIASTVFGSGSAILAYVVARRRWSWLLCLPAFLGPLVLALLVLALFQLPGLLNLRDTIAPLLFALTLWLLPAALLLRLALAGENGAALHLARLLREPGELIWHLKTRKEFWLVFILFCWGYFELTVSAILAPITFMPASVRLYNLMHYGQTAVLSAMLCVVLIVPGVVWLIARMVHHGKRALAT